MRGKVEWSVTGWDDGRGGLGVWKEFRGSIYEFLCRVGLVGFLLRGDGVGTGSKGRE